MKTSSPALTRLSSASLVRVWGKLPGSSPIRRFASRRAPVSGTSIHRRPCPISTAILLTRAELLQNPHLIAASPVQLVEDISPISVVGIRE